MGGNGSKIETNSQPQTFRGVSRHDTLGGDCTQGED